MDNNNGDIHRGEPQPPVAGRHQGVGGDHVGGPPISNINRSAGGGAGAAAGGGAGPIKTTPRAANARYAEDITSDVASDTPILL